MLYLKQCSYSFKLRIFLNKIKKNLSSLVVALLFSAPSYTTQDISTIQSFNPSTNQRVFLISFAEGEVYEKNQNHLAFTAINTGIDTIISYRRRHIAREFYQKNKKILDMKRGGGYWLWKPYFILETLKIMSPNDILIYVDAGISFKETIEPILELLKSPDTNMLLFTNFHSNRHFIKRDTFDIMEVDYKHRDDQHLDAAFLALKKTDVSYDFIEKWLNYCCIEKAITDIPSEAKEFEDFRTHRHDQAILSLLYRKYNNPTIKLVSRRHRKSSARIFYHHRRRASDEPIKNMKYDHPEEK